MVIRSQNMSQTSNSHGKLPWVMQDFDWLMLPTTANDIIGMVFDWLMLPTTANKIIGIKKPNLHKILIFSPPPLKKPPAEPE